MKTHKLLSLLTAAAISATTFVGVVFTANANYSDTGSLITWDFGEYTDQVTLNSDLPL